MNQVTTEQGSKEPSIDDTQQEKKDQEEEEEDDHENKNKMSKENILAIVSDMNMQIGFMDFSFEQAFQQKDKEFMIAYRGHIQMIQKEIDSIKKNSTDEKYLKTKMDKICNLESKLGQIRKQALFLGDMSELHQKAIKK